MFRQLQFKFIGIAAFSMVLVIGGVLFLVNFITYRIALSNVYTNLEYIFQLDNPSSDDFVNQDDDVYITPEIQHEYRYLTVVINKNGAIVTINDDHISAINESDMNDFIEFAAKNRRKRGIYNFGKLTYAFMKRKLNDGSMKIIIMDCTRNLSAVHFFIDFSFYIGAISLMLFILVMTVFSKKAIRPYVKNIEAQKQFITNASHELKTPLAVISANTEVIEMTSGKSEWTESTVKQVSKMSNLISQLVVLSRLEERPDIVLTEVNMTDEVNKVIDDFKTVAETQGYSFTSNVDEGAVIKADEKGIHELINILIDNAIKYCDENGKVEVKLNKKGKNVNLIVSNDYAEGEGQDYKRFFDRFYRADLSHNSEKKGYGIGLSMAESLVRMFKGKISVNYKKPMISFVVTFAQKA